MTQVCVWCFTVVKRAADETLGLEEVDGLQTDLETLLASVAKRMRLLESQINILVVWLEKGKVDKKSLPAAVASVATPSAASVATAATTASTSSAVASSKTVSLIVVLSGNI